MSVTRLRVANSSAMNEATGPIINPSTSVTRSVGDDEEPHVVHRDRLDRPDALRRREDRANDEGRPPPEPV